MSMKKFILMQILLFVCTLLHAQIDCGEYVKKVDSLIQIDNMYIDKRNKPDIDCEIPLLEYTKGKGYIGSSSSSEFYIKMILSYLSENGTLRTTREQAINELLLRNYHFRMGYYYQFHKEDFNNQALLRLKDLLQKRYSPEEENRYIKYYTRFIFKDTLYIAQMIYDEAKKRDIIDYSRTKDSVTAVVLDRYKKKLYNEDYSIHLPLLIGWCDFKEFIPLLDSIQNVDGDVSVQIALARMGNKKYQNYFLQFDNIDLPIAFYIGTQDLIAKYGELLYSEEKKVYLSGPPELTEKIPVKYNIIIDLQSNIANFPKLIDREFYLWFQKDIDALPPDVVEKARQWMKENKGKYIVSSNFLPYFYMIDKYRKLP